MKLRLATTLLLVVGLAVAAVSVSATTTTRPALAATGTTWPISTYGTPRPEDNVILKWNEQLLSTIRAYPAATGPTITARALGVLHTATYDAWAAYDPTAKITRPDGPAQQSGGTAAEIQAKKNEAISHAAHWVLNDLFPASKFPDVPATATDPGYRTPDELLSSQGYDPTNTTTTGTTPAAVGNLAGKAVMNYRHGDGSNQLNGYADTTGYEAENTWDVVNNRWAWQPLCVPNANPPATAIPCPGGAVQGALTPQWGEVTMFSTKPASSYRVTGPPKNPDGSYSTIDIPRILADATYLDDVKKVTAEYWADGPKSEFPPGHTAIFAQAVSRKKGHSLDNDVKLFFLVGNAVMDAGIASWWQKYEYDYVRPVTAIREHYKNTPGGVATWLGPNLGWAKRPSSQWTPYQAPNVVTPPFPEYVSGHSTFTAAGAHILATFNGDAFGATVVVPARSSKFESNTPAKPVTLTFSTFSQASADAGISRRYGGIHFLTGDLHGRALGKQVGQNVWFQGQNYIRGLIGY
jgi:PAP2 superfamily